MTAITYLIPISIVLAIAAFVAFLWSVRSSQYNDPEGDAERILDAEDVPLSETDKNHLRS